MTGHLADLARLSLAELLLELSTASPRTVRLVVALLIASGCWLVVSRARPPLLPWFAVLASGLLWLRADQRHEGRILLVLSADHGLTEADLLVPVVAGIAVALRGLRLALERYLRFRKRRWGTAARGSGAER